MLEIKIPKRELWDEAKEEFVTTKEQTLQLEHSLVSLSKWESKWCKSFINQKDLTSEEMLDYIKCMTINRNVDPEVYNYLSTSELNKINEYINAPMTATTFSNNKKGNNREIITSELIYYWMIACNIPFECQKWHINRLLTLIRVCEAKNQAPKKMGKGELMRRNAALNAARRKKLHSRG